MGITKLFFAVLSALLAFLVQSNANSVKCGQQPGIATRMFGGTETDKGEWPWLVAFVYLPTEQFQGSGTLITAKHVLSGENEPNFWSKKTHHSVLFL